MSWFEKIMPSRIKTERRTRSVPEGLWIKCPACDSVLYRAELERNLNVCPKCSHHMRIGARARLLAFYFEKYWQPPPPQRRGTNSHAAIYAYQKRRAHHRARRFCFAGVKPEQEKANQGGGGRS